MKDFCGVVSKATPDVAKTRQNQELNSNTSKKRTFKELKKMWEDFKSKLLED